MLCELIFAMSRHPVVVAFGKWQATTPTPVIAAYGVFGMIGLAIHHFVAGGAFSSIITMSSVVQCLGITLLCIKVLSCGSAEGISAGSLKLDAFAFAFRLSSTTWLNGYLPVDASGDYVIQAVDMCSLAMVLSAVLADPHPTLPTMWTSVTKEDEVGVVYESENFVEDHQITADNPDAKWTNYTDGSCQRLIYKDLNEDSRYLLKCDAVNCCREDGNDGTVEYQIPNVHPAILAPVHYRGQQTFTRFDGVSVTADTYEWTFLIEKTTAFVTNGTGPDSTAVLQKWVVEAGGQPYPNQYANYTEVPASEAAAFKATFKVPEVCRGNILPCANAHREGLLSAKSLRFLRAGRKTSQKLRRARSPKAGCGSDLGEIEVGLGLAVLDVKNAATACNSNGTSLTECTDDVAKINAQLSKISGHVTAASTDCNPTAGTGCAFNLGNLTKDVAKATAEFGHAATYCANVHGRVLCDASIAAGTLSVIAAVSENSNAINSCE